LIIALVFCLTGSAYATYDIILISDCDAPGTNPDGNHADDALVEWLESLGYTVDTSGMGKAYQENNNPFDDPAKVGALESAGLVIVSHMTNSGGYDDDRKAWNELNNPLLLCSGHLTSGGSDQKWGWTTGGSSDAEKTVTDIDVVDLHPFIPTTPSLFDWSQAPTSGEAPKGVYLPNSSEEIVAGGVVVATLDGQPMLIDYAAGTDFDAGNSGAEYGVAGGRRAFLGHWGYDVELYYGEGDPRNGPASWGDFITDDYKALMAQTIAEMIPEPATIVMLGLGGLALLRRRR